MLAFPHRTPQSVAHCCTRLHLLCSHPCIRVTCVLHGPRSKRHGTMFTAFVGLVRACSDCKEQFNNVHPATIIQHMCEAAAWLKQRRRLCATTLGLNVHKQNIKLDIAGQTKKSTFDFISMDALIELAWFSLLQDNKVLAAGESWRCECAIPMGGPFSTQSADLQCVRRCKTLVHLLRHMGAMSVTPSGILQWACCGAQAVPRQCHGSCEGASSPSCHVPVLHDFRAGLALARFMPLPRQKSRGHLSGRMHDNACALQGCHCVCFHRCGLLSFTPKHPRQTRPTEIWGTLAELLGLKGTAYNKCFSITPL